MKHIQGLIPATLTPCKPDGGLNLSLIEPYAALLVEAKVTGVFACGTTGESLSLTVEERKRVAAEWVRVAGDKLAVVMHVGCYGQKDAVELAAHAREVGAAAVAALAPGYFKPRNVEDLVDFLKPIAAAAAPLPFYYYEIPSFTGVKLATDEILRLCGQRMSNFAGMKFTHDDLAMLQSCLNLDGGRYNVLFGGDEILMASLVMGCKGSVGATYNYAAPVFHRVMDCFARGDLQPARAAQLQTVELARVLGRFGSLRAHKAIMGLMGLDCGPMRPPLRTITGPELRSLYEALLPLDIFQRPLKLPRGL